MKREPKSWAAIPRQMRNEIEERGGVPRLLRPGFEWLEFGGRTRWVALLRPVNRMWVIDTVGNGTADELITLGQFEARVEHSGDHFRVVTQAGGDGGRRYRTAWTEEAAMEILRRWYERRFRYVDIVPVRH